MTNDQTGRKQEMAKQRLHGEGSITQITPNKFRLRYDGPPHSDGSRKQESETFNGTKGNAVKWLQQQIRATDEGTYIKPQSQTVGEYLTSWVTAHAANVQIRTTEHYRAVIRRYLVPEIGNLPLQRLEETHIERLYTALKDRGLKSSSIAVVHAVLKKALSDACRLRVLKRNPAQFVTAPKKNRRRPEAWSVEDINRFLQAAEGNPYQDVFDLALRTGTRRAELAGLKWQDVDLKRGAITISRSLYRVAGGKLVEGDTKNHRSRRIAISGNTIALVKRIRGKQAEQRLQAGPVWEDTDHVFTNELGKPFDGANFYMAFKSVVREAGLRDSLTLHSARHAFVALLAAEGVDARIISEMAGHHSVGFTLSVYGYLFEGMQESAAAAIDSALSR